MQAGGGRCGRLQRAASRSCWRPILWAMNPLGFRNPLGYNGFNGGAYPTFDKDHDEKGRPTYYKK